MKRCETSVLVDVDRGGSTVRSRVQRLDEEGRGAISAVTATDLRIGVNRRYDPGSRDEHHRSLDRLLDRFAIVPVSRPIATAAADLSVNQERSGTPLHDLHELYVAATVRVEALTLLTANTGHFGRFDGLEVLDWTAY